MLKAEPPSIAVFLDLCAGSVIVHRVNMFMFIAGPHGRADRRNLPIIIGSVLGLRFAFETHHCGLTSQAHGKPHVLGSGWLQSMVYEIGMAVQMRTTETRAISFI